ncbi:uncharacterized protein LOC131958617 [Physella acuta]|uniref:uncharacterized protein LOC131958617 n=1 Tax=Physella acuta TaxID=109671 RepID=UPI0027DAE8CF|nr:uncharacterized protein LOC131958617 [Physella acuta]
MFTLLAVLALLAACHAAPACDGFNVNITMTRCLTDNGFTYDDIKGLIPNDAGAISFDENDYRLLCTKRMEYQKASVCIIDELNRCQSAGDISITPNIDQSIKVMNMMCDDPNFKLECVVLLTKNSTEVQKCVSENYDVIAEMRTKTMQEVVCESSKVGVKCAVDIIRKCDEHTADVVLGASYMSLPAVCSNSTAS